MSVVANPEAWGFESFMQRNLEKDLLRFTTAGSVDDGKSTLIGRLLHDSKSVFEDQMAAVKKSRINRSTGAVDFSLLTDGLRAEREQGITIDVAYRYFETPRRKFIIADTPGHEQYTRNMATGASTANLAVILIDSTKGVLAQTRRHTYIASLLGIPNVLVAINKMDLVEYREEVFLKLQKDFDALAKQLAVPHVVAIPISALAGDNVVARSEHMPWYHGPTFLEHLETVPIRMETPSDAVRFPVQYVIRPDQTFRGFAGQVASGVIRPGDPVVSLPSEQKSRVKAIVTFDGDAPEAFSPMSVTLTLEDEIDLSRGDMLVSPAHPPRVSRHFDAMVVWFNAEAAEPGKSYLLKHTSRTVRAKALKIHYRVNVNTLVQEPAEQPANERYRLRGIRNRQPAFLRSLHAKPHHRQLHPDRSDFERHARRRNDSRRPVGPSQLPPAIRAGTSARDGERALQATRPPTRADRRGRQSGARHAPGTRPVRRSFRGPARERRCSLRSRSGKAVRGIPIGRPRRDLLLRQTRVRGET